MVELPAADHRADRDVVAGRSQMQQHVRRSASTSLAILSVSITTTHVALRETLADRRPPSAQTRPSVIVRPSFGISRSDAAAMLSGR